MKVYISKEGDQTMIYDHENGVACWGEKFYFVSFEGIKKFWFLIGEY